MAGPSVTLKRQTIGKILLAIGDRHETIIAPLFEQATKFGARRIPNQLIALSIQGTRFHRRPKGIRDSRIATILFIIKEKIGKTDCSRTGRAAAPRPGSHQPGYQAQVSGGPCYGTQSYPRRYSHLAAASSGFSVSFDIHSHHPPGYGEKLISINFSESAMLGNSTNDLGSGVWLGSEF